jgi:S1-C subfamily serine protease
MRDEAKALLRAAGVAVAAIALVLIGIAIGANMWPKVVRVEQRVVERGAPAAPGGGTLLDLADMVQDDCPGIVLLSTPSGPPPAPARTPSRRKRGRRSHAATGKAAPPAVHLGLFISPDGAILTPSAGLGDGNAVTAMLSDGRELPAQRVRTDSLSGLALLKVDAATPGFLELAQQMFPRVGDIAVAAGSPRGTGCSARLSMIGADFLAETPGLTAYVRPDPPTDPQTVGTPLLAPDGTVIAIGGTYGDDPDDAMPSQVAARVASILLRASSPPEEKVGLLTDDLTPQLAARLGADRQRGAVVLLVAPGSAAARSGLMAGDVILSAGDAPISSASELERTLDGRTDSLDLQVLRHGTTITVTLTPPPAASGGA